MNVLAGRDGARGEADQLAIFQHLAAFRNGRGGDLVAGGHVGDGSQAGLDERPARDCLARHHDIVLIVEANRGRVLAGDGRHVRNPC